MHQYPHNCCDKACPPHPPSASLNSSFLSIGNELTKYLGKIPSLSENKVFWDIWINIENSLNELFRHPKESCINGIELYTQVYILCTAKPKQLDTELYSALTAYLSKKAEESRLRFLDEGINLLECYSNEWKKYKSACKTMCIAFNYLNRVILNDNHKLDLSFQKKILENLFPLVWREVVMLWMKMEGANKIVKNIFYYFHNQRKSIINYIENNDGDESLKNDDNLKYLKDSIKSYIKCDPGRYLYREEIEIPLERDTISHYKILIYEQSKDLSISSYLKFSNQALLKEERLLSKYFDPSSFIPVMTACNELFVNCRKEELYIIFEKMLLDNQRVDIQNAYNLMKRVDGCVKPLLEIFENCIAKKGRLLASQLQYATLKEYANKIVFMLINLHEEFTELQINLFEGDLNFETAIDKAMRSLVNERFAVSLTVALVSVCDCILWYCDDVLTNEITTGIDKTLFLFKYIDDKDAFLKAYTKSLANRVLFGKRYSSFELSGKLDSDALMIGKLRAICGVEFTSKLEKIYTDIYFASDIQELFIDSVKVKKNLCNEFDNGAKYRSSLSNMSFYPKILTSGCWPLHSTIDQINELCQDLLDQKLKDNCDAFQEFYVKKYDGRKLQWIYSLSTVEIVIFKTQNHPNITVKLPFVHYIVFNQFKNSVELRNEFSLSEIIILTKFPESILLTIMRDLVDSCLLKVVEGNNGIENIYLFDDKILSVVNSSLPIKIPFPIQLMFTYSPDQLNFTSLQPNQGNSKSPLLSTVNYLTCDQLPSSINSSLTSSINSGNSTFDEDKRLFLQATIIRIMKKHKEMCHNNLIKLIFEECGKRFVPDIVSIKKTIEFLIEKQFIERDSSKVENYLYVA